MWTLGFGITPGSFWARNWLIITKKKKTNPLWIVWTAAGCSRDERSPTVSHRLAERDRVQHCLHTQWWTALSTCGFEHRATPGWRGGSRGRAAASVQIDFIYFKYTCSLSWKNHGKPWGSCGRYGGKARAVFTRCCRVHAVSLVIFFFLFDFFFHEF